MWARLECPNCDVTLVLHRGEASVACHHCGHREHVPKNCPDCGSVSIARHGTGTERLADDLAQTGRQVFRLDADVTHAGRVLSAFGAADQGILVGTQLVAKGHDFPDIALAVVVDADSTLRFPDFRAEERTFALVTQLAGRAGRGADKADVSVPNPGARRRSDPPRGAARRRRLSRAASLRGRRELRYPPFATLIRVVCSSEVPGAAQAAAAAVRERLGDEAIGPAPLFRLRGRERAQVVVKASDRHAAIAEVRAAVDAATAGRTHKDANFSVDVDPQ